VKILFSLEIVQKKTNKSNSAAISGFLCNKYYKRIISPLEGAENAYQLRPDQWSLVLMMSGETFFDFYETVDGWNLFLYTTTRQTYFYNI
jgi:hypothetical protein